MIIESCNLIGWETFGLLLEQKNFARDDVDTRKLYFIRKFISVHSIQKVNDKMFQREVHTASLGHLTAPFPKNQGLYNSSSEILL